MTSSGMPDLPNLPELKRVTTADVHKAGTRVGTLTRSPAGEVTFAYLTGHGATPSRPPCPSTSAP